jgi:hypothetical protein
VIYGDGTCAVCGQHIPMGRLMCPADWFNVPGPLRNAVYLALRRWDRQEGTLLELRQAQAAAVESVTGVAQEPTLEGGEDVKG